MPIVCNTVYEGKAVFLVLEVLDESNDGFWWDLVHEVEKTDECKKFIKGARMEGSLEDQTVSSFSNLKLAVQGFANALTLRNTLGSRKYVAYATFDPSSIDIDDAWKALNVQMCMTVTGHEDLPVTTHMGIFVSPFSKAVKLPEEYRLAFEAKTPNKMSLEDYFSPKRVEKLSLLLHRFAFQAYRLANPRVDVEYVVTKPLPNMTKIFEIGGVIAEHAVILSAESISVHEYMLRNKCTRIAYRVDVGSKVVIIAINEPDSIKEYRVTTDQFSSNPFIDLIEQSDRRSMKKSGSVSASGTLALPQPSSAAMPNPSSQRSRSPSPVRRVSFQTPVDRPRSPASDERKDVGNSVPFANSGLNSSANIATLTSNRPPNPSQVSVPQRPLLSRVSGTIRPVSIPQTHSGIPSRSSGSMACSSQSAPRNSSVCPAPSAKEARHPTSADKTMRPTSSGSATFMNAGSQHPPPIMSMPPPPCVGNSHLSTGVSLSAVPRKVSASRKHVSSNHSPAEVFAPYLWKLAFNPTHKYPTVFIDGWKLNRVPLPLQVKS